MLQQIAERRNATARQIALAFLLRHPNVLVIPKAARVEHVQDNAGAGNLQLDAADIAAIDAAFKRGAPKKNLPMI